MALGGGLQQIPAMAFGRFRRLGGCLFLLILSFLSFLGKSNRSGEVFARKKTQKVIWCFHV
jgi:hypothetical protein